jgi:hypothetical protein
LWTARWKLVSLLLSQSAQAGAIIALVSYIFFELITNQEVTYAWNFGAFLLAWPPILLGPLFGYLRDRFPRPEFSPGPHLAAPPYSAPSPGAWNGCGAGAWCAWPSRNIEWRAAHGYPWPQ